MEGAPKPKLEQKVEVKSIETQEQFMHQVEDVVAHTKEMHESCINHPDSVTCTTETLHSEIEHSSVGGVFEDYEKHKMVTLADVSESVQILSDRLEKELQDDVWDEEDRKSLSQKFNLIKERDHEIRSGIRRYVGTLSKFYILKKQRDRLDPEEFKQEMEAVDRRRRAAHDSLINSLQLYAKLVYDLQEEDVIEGITVNSWGQGEEFNKSGEENEVCVFAPSFLTNRDFIKDWAISAHLYETLEKIQEIQKDGSSE